MRIEPKILDSKIERKSLNQKSKPQPEEIDSFDCLFGDTPEETLSRLECIDDEDRRRSEECRWTGEDLGRATINTPSVDKIDQEKTELLLSFNDSELALKGLLSPEQIKKMEETKGLLEEQMENAF